MSPRRLPDYLAGWQGHLPTAVYSHEYFRRDPSVAMRVHRRTWLGSDRLARNVALFPQRAWLAARWRARPAQESLFPSESSMQELAAACGVPLEVQRERLAQLRRDPGVPAQEAHLLGLSRDGEASRWPEFLFRIERNWNVAASGVVLGNTAAARRSVRLLADKEATARMLASLDVPVVSSLVARDEPELIAGLEATLARGGEAFVKPRYGSAGRGAAYAVRDETGYVLRPYRRGSNDNAITVSELARGAPLIIQPRLATPGWEGLDVVTIRIVTRDRGQGPEVFSQVLEVPRAPHYDHHQLVDGRIGGVLTALWLPSLAPRLSPPLAALEPIPPWIATAATAAHAQLPGLFAVAWDVALTAQGPQFLEGNTGFGTLMPQLASASGLLSGLRDHGG